MTKEEAYEKLDHTLCLNNVKGNIEFSIGNIDCQSVEEMVDCLELIKPKQYLKWEDLEFKEEEQTMIVKIGDNQYKIWYRQFKNGKQTMQIANYYPFRSLAILYDKDIDKQFFNDLHLERVEE